MEQTEHHAALARDIARLKAIRNNNLGLGVFTLSAGVVGSVSPVDLGEQQATIADVPHEFSDGYVNNERIKIEKNSYDEDVIFRRRRKGYAVISFFAGAFGVKSGYDFIKFVEEGFPSVSLVETGAKFIVGGIVAKVNFKNKKISDELETNSENIKDAKHHADKDMKASFAAAGFIAASGIHSLFSVIGGIFTSAYTAWHMRPTRKNLQHHSN